MKLSEELKKIEREIRDLALELVSRDQSTGLRVLGEARKLRRVRKIVEAKGLEA